MKGFMLYLITYLLEPFVLMANIIVVLAKNKNLDGYFYIDSVARDRYANYNYRSLWCFLFIKKIGYKFGNDEETISGVLGKNQRDSEIVTLKTIYICKLRIENNRFSNMKRAGNLMCNILDTLEKNHCKNAIINF